MSNPSVSHATFSIERVYPVPPERVFAAFSNPISKRRWFAENESKAVEEFSMDFRVGGTESSRFLLGADSPMPGAPITNRTTYFDIVPNQRIVFAYSMSMMDKPFSVSLATIDLLGDAGGTRLVFTEQAAFFAHSDGAKLREAGWQELLAKLAEEVSRQA